MVGEHSVELLRHRPVARAHARLHVRHRNPQLCRSERAGQGRIRVAVNERHVRRPFPQHRLERREHARRLLGRSAGPDAQLVVRRGHIELLEEDP